MGKIHTNEIMEISKEYKFIQVKVTGQAIDRLSSLACAVTSPGDRSMTEVYIDLDDYCDLGVSDDLIDEVQEINKNINMIVFYD